MRPLLRAKSSLWIVAALAETRRAACPAATALVGARPITRVTRRLIGLADRAHGVALAGAGLPVDEREALGAGRVAEGQGLFARDAVEFLAGFKTARAHPVADVMRRVAAQGRRRRASTCPSASSTALRRVAGRRAARRVGQAHGVGMAKTLLGELRPLEVRS